MVSFQSIESFSHFLCQVKAMCAIEWTSPVQAGERANRAWVYTAVLVFYGFKAKLSQLLILGTWMKFLKYF